MLSFIRPAGVVSAGQLLYNGGHRGSKGDAASPVLLKPTTISLVSRAGSCAAYQAAGCSSSLLHAALSVLRSHLRTFLDQRPPATVPGRDLHVVKWWPCHMTALSETQRVLYRSRGGVYNCKIHKDTKTILIAVFFKIIRKYILSEIKAAVSEFWSNFWENTQQWGSKTLNFLQQNLTAMSLLLNWQ